MHNMLNQNCDQSNQQHYCNDLDTHGLSDCHRGTLSLLVCLVVGVFVEVSRVYYKTSNLAVLVANDLLKYYSLPSPLTGRSRRLTGLSTIAIGVPTHGWGTGFWVRVQNSKNGNWETEICDITPPSGAGLLRSPSSHLAITPLGSRGSYSVGRGTSGKWTCSM